MPVSLAYLLVIIIWSTTPLGIVWSSESMPPTLALMLRMLIALVLGWPLMKLLKVELPWHKEARLVYIYSALSIALGMLCCYLAARHISSGLMSLSFGVAPLLSGIFAQRILGDAPFSPLKKLALLLALLGLALVCMESIAIGEGAWYGFMCISGGVILFALSGVMVKSVKVTIHPLAITVGTLLISMPLFVLFWLIMDGELALQAWQPRAVWSVIYLGVFASLIAFLAYFYVLNNLPATTVTLIVMVTPVLSAALGAWLNNEVFNLAMLAGGSLVLVGLGAFLFGDKLLLKRRNVIQITTSSK